MSKLWRLNCQNSKRNLPSFEPSNILKHWGRPKLRKMSNTFQIKELPKFSGDKEDFLGYSMLFKAVANLKTFDALKGTNKPVSGDLREDIVLAGEWESIKEYYR